MSTDEHVNSDDDSGCGGGAHPDLAEVIAAVKENDRPWLAPEGWRRLRLSTAPSSADAAALAPLLQADLAPYISHCRRGASTSSCSTTTCRHGGRCSNCNNDSTRPSSSAAAADAATLPAAGKPGVASSATWRRPVVFERPPSRAEFVAAGEAPNVPVLIRGCTADWVAAVRPGGRQQQPQCGGDNGDGSNGEEEEDDEETVAAGGWSFEALRRRFPDAFFRVSDTHGAVVTLDEYRAYTRGEAVGAGHGVDGDDGGDRSRNSGPDDCPFGLYDSQFGAADDERQAMVGEYRVPACLNQDLFQLCGAARPPFRWLLLGPRRSGTAMHVDPLLTHAWVTLLQGAKRWCLFPAGTPRHLLGCWVEVHGSFVDSRSSTPVEPAPVGDGGGDGMADAVGGVGAAAERRTVQGGRGRRAAVAQEPRAAGIGGGNSEEAAAKKGAVGQDEAGHNNNDADADNDSTTAADDNVSLPRLNAAEWYLRVYPRVHQSPDAFPEQFRPVEVLQLPGETVYVPAGWPHVVINVGEMNVAVTHNFATANGPYGPHASFGRLMECVRAEEPEFFNEQLGPAMAAVKDKHAPCPQVDPVTNVAVPPPAAVLCTS